ncbi:Cof-type HAD-IIB family hydrolase [Opitutaceae bacterium EW11]|nr:Cof-type HAD-IIB family hydrolase [Opitutaceae bacterium EW11]
MGTASFPYQLCAIDIDDTLIGLDREISLQNREAIADLRTRGCEVLLASGRRHENMLPFANELGLTGCLVSCQGARAQELSTGRVLHRAEVPRSVADGLVAEGVRRGFTVFVWLEKGIYATEAGRWVDVYRHESGGDPVTIVDPGQLAGQDAEKIVWSGSPEKVAEAARGMRGSTPAGVHGMITNDWYLEFTASEATKAAAVAAVARDRGVPREAVLAFGDGNNDVPLLSWAGLGIAMPHGRESARKAAARVGPPGNPETALARAIRTLPGLASRGRLAAEAAG